MSTLRTLTALFMCSLLSCNNYQEKINSESIDSTNKLAATDSLSKPISKDTLLAADTIQRFIVDDFPVSYEMMRKQEADNYSSYTKTSGKTRSLDKAWFTNDTLQQTLIFELYTDGHRLVTYHFYTNDIPADLIDRIELHNENGDLANKQQKLRDFKGFLNQAVKIDKKFFTTDKGLSLGDDKQKVLKIYGKPDKKTEKNGVQKTGMEFCRRHFV